MTVDFASSTWTSAASIEEAEGVDFAGVVVPGVVVAGVLVVAEVVLVIGVVDEPLPALGTEVVVVVGAGLVRVVPAAPVCVVLVGFV